MPSKLIELQLPPRDYDERSNGKDGENPDYSFEELVHEGPNSLAQSQLSLDSQKNYWSSRLGFERRPAAEVRAQKAACAVVGLLQDRAFE